MSNEISLKHHITEFNIDILCEFIHNYIGNKVIYTIRKSYPHDEIFITVDIVVDGSLATLFYFVGNMAIQIRVNNESCNYTEILKLFQIEYGRSKNIYLLEQSID